LREDFANCRIAERAVDDGRVLAVHVSRVTHGTAERVLESRRRHDDANPRRPVDRLARSRIRCPST
jgi:hypothetical protein